MMWGAGGKYPLLLLVSFVLLITFPRNGVGILHRKNEQVTFRKMTIPTSQDPDKEYDRITLSNYLRTYMRGPINDEYGLFTHDVIAAYAGPPVPGSDTDVLINNEMRNIRVWAMFDAKTKIACNLNEVHNYGEVALFSCQTEGIYRAYAMEIDSDVSNEYELRSSITAHPTRTWVNRDAMKSFDLIHNSRQALLQHVYGGVGGNVSGLTTQDRVEHLLARDNITTSDPIVVKSSYYCYYWMFTTMDEATPGYSDEGLVPHTRGENGSSYQLKTLRIWVAEPTAIKLDESDDRLRELDISDYSKVITNRFHDTGLFPCLRKAHPIIQIMSEIEYVSEIDQNNPLRGAPHWKAVLKIHTDRLISTLSDVTFTIASRQSTGSFHCFVADTRVFASVREFEFVDQKKLRPKSINWKESNIWHVQKLLYEHQISHIYGHGVQFIGNKYTKLFQPATTRTDMQVIGNPCMSQEFAVVAAGSLYIAERFMRGGMKFLNRVILPDFKSEYGIKSDPNYFRNYLRVTDVAFTPTHVVILMSDGSVILQPTSASIYGMGQITDTSKYRPDTLVRRKSCPKTSTPKYSAMMVPLFSRTGNIIVLHLYSIEKSVRMWITPPKASCVVEGMEIFDKNFDVSSLINETDIHYDEYRAVKRTNHKTGLEEPPPPERPNPPAASTVPNLEQMTAYLANENVLLGSGFDPHYPEVLLDPARHVIGDDLTDYNYAVIYSIENEKKGLQRLLTSNGINPKASSANSGDKSELGLYTVEFAAIEKQLIIAVKFQAQEIPREFGAPDKIPFQMIITTVTVTNYPFRLKIDKTQRDTDEIVDSIVPFPGTIIVRSQPFTITNVESNDPMEQDDHLEHLKGTTEVEFTPQVFIMNTAIPSYVINFGDILVYTSLESRYARPLHFYGWGVVHDQKRKAHLTFSESTIKFAKNETMHDVVVSDQGIISVLWRKKKRRYVKETATNETDSIDKESYRQPVAMGSVISLEGLREVDPFYRLDNVFQLVTPEGEVLYGIYDTQPHTPYQDCVKNVTWEKNFGGRKACVLQEETDGELPYCTKSTRGPCKSPSTLPACNSTSSAPGDACIIIEESMCRNKGNMKCWPLYAPLEELRSINLLSTPFLSYLLGSLQYVKSTHPEAPEVTKNKTEAILDDLDEDLDICPFSSFKVYSQNFDFAEVGYQTRITGEVSYFGTGIPTEADLIVEFDNIMGVVVEVSSSVEEQRGLTTIKKTIDMSFQMTDFILSEFSSKDAKEENDLIWQRLEFDDIRAREKSSVFSVTVRPSIVNNHCKSTDYFKTVQFNVGCNTFSNLRLVSEAAPFTKQLLRSKNTSEPEDEEEAKFKWKEKDGSGGEALEVPRQHVYHRQAKEGVFNCTTDNEKIDRSKCTIPHYDKYGDNIFTVSYRDYFYPKFEQFLTVSSRPVKGNVVLYDLMGSKEFNLTVNNLQAGCHGIADFWYDKLVNTTGYIGKGATEHENIYRYFVDCFDASDPEAREQSQQLSATSFHLHNTTNNNRIKFLRQRNQILIFRAVAVNTDYNRFTYCKTLETFFLVRVTGIPIPRQGLNLWYYLAIAFLVFISLVITYLIFFRFYTWKLDSVETTVTYSERPLTGEKVITD